MRLSRGAALALRTAVGLGLAFIYVPLIVLAIYAFNSSNILEWPPPGLTLDWFPKAIREEAAREAFLTSLKAGAAATAIALGLGTLAALAVARHRFFGRETISFLVILPGGHILRAAEDVSGVGDRARIGGPRYAEVRHLHVIRIGQEDVAWFYVSVYDAAYVRSLEGLGDLERHLRCRLGSQRARGCDPLLEGAAGQVLHSYVVCPVVRLAPVEDGYDVRTA